MAGTGGKGGTAASPVFQDLGWTQDLDLSFVKTFEAATKGTVLPTANIHFTSASAAGEKTYFELLVNNVTVSSLNLTANDSDRPHVTGSLGYQKMTVTYYTLDAKGIGKPTSASFDLVTGKGSAAELANLFALGLSGPEAVIVPLPGAAWLLGASLLALAGSRTRRGKREE